jgi:hypothetical protein
MQLNSGNPGFSSLVAGDLGSDGTGADGFDAVLTGLAAAVTADGVIRSTFDSFILQMDFQQGALAAGLLNPLISDFAGFLSSGNSLAAAVDLSSAGGAPAPPPPKIPVVINKPIATPPVHGGVTVGGGGDYGGEPPWFDPHNPDTWGDASGGGSMIPHPPTMDTQ